MEIQDKFNEPNVIYKITKDIDLEGTTLTMPAGCTLDFQGGSFSNGSVVGNNTSIKATPNKIFDSNINLIGTWDIEETYAEWFGAKGDNTTDDYLSFNKALTFMTLSPNSSNVLKLSNKTYKISQPINLPVRCSIFGCGTKTSQLSFYNNTNGLILTDYVDVSGATLKDFSISGKYNSNDIGTIDNTNVEDYSIGIVMKTTNYAVIQNVKIAGFVTGIYMNTAVLNSFSNLYIGYCNNGVFLQNGSYHNKILFSTITACVAVGINASISTLQLIGIDIEATATSVLSLSGSNINIIQSHFEGNNTATCISINTNGKVNVDSCLFGGFLYGFKSSANIATLNARYNTFVGVENEFDIPQLSEYIIEYNKTSTSQGGTKQFVYNVNNNKGILIKDIYSNNGYTLDFNTEIKAKSFKIGNYKTVTTKYKGQIVYGSEITIAAGSVKVVFIDVQGATLSQYEDIVVVGLSNLADAQYIVANGKVRKNFTNQLQILMQNLGSEDVSITPVFNIVVL